MAIEIPTTLILGAGASVHVGYPLGMQLVNEIVQQYRARNIALPIRRPGTVEINEFVDRLSRSGHYSIDAFLESEPNMMEVGKYLIASVLKSRENVGKLFPPNNSGWYQYLFNKLVSEGPPSVAPSKVTIVTFNYDRSLEAYLFEALKARFKFSDQDATHELNTINILHVHGQLGPYPGVEYTPSTAADDIRKAAEGIRVVSEISDPKEGFCNAEFEQANKAISASSRVIFLGFGFHEDNLRRLTGGAKDFWKGETYLFCGIRGSAKQKKLAVTLQKYGIKPSHNIGYAIYTSENLGTELIDL